MVREFLDNRFSPAAVFCLFAYFFADLPVKVYNFGIHGFDYLTQVVSDAILLYSLNSNGGKMRIYIETLVLYFVLFFSGSTGFFTIASEPGSFSITAELVRLFVYTIPSLVLIWYLLYRSWVRKTWNIRPGKKDLTPCLISLAGLLITGFLIAFVSSGIDANAAQVQLKLPSTTAGWVVLCISCISAAYLEESFFRFYILSRRDEMRLNAASALIVSVALFSICHIYEGPWGFLNSVLSGALLSFIFLRYNSLHGIAAAHSLYNIAVYAINAVLIK